MSVRISVLICTRNRADLLGEALESALRQTLSREAYEVIVVDNGSTDGTAEVVKRRRPEGAVRYLREERPGLCHARNAGWRAARAPYVAYLDDDARAEPPWLERILHAFETVRPTPGCIGGRVDPVWEAPRPRWLSDDLALLLAVARWSEEPLVLEDLDQQWLVGVNLAVRRDLLEAVGGFAPWLDRVGNRLLSSGDVYLQMQVQRLGHPCLFLPGAVVHHRVSPGRMRKGWFLRRCFWQGISDSLMYLADERPDALRRTTAGLRRGGALLRTPLRVVNLVLPTGEPRRFTLKCMDMIRVGQVAGLLGAARSP